MDLTGEQKKALRDALTKAFGDYDALRIMVAFGLNENLNAIANARNINNAAFDLVAWAVATEHVVDLIASARAENPRNSALRRVAEDLAMARDPFANDGGFPEAVIIKQAGFADPAPWREQMNVNELPVFRIEVTGVKHKPVGIGTGFLIGPNAALTADHVFERNGIHAGNISRAQVAARFDYSVAVAGHAPTSGKAYPLRKASDWLLDRSPEDKLDYTYFRLEGTPGEDAIGGTPQSPRRGWLAPESHVFQEYEPLLILQHPEGDPLALAIGAVSEVAAQRIKHKANTEPGSSGAPCFSAKWKLAAIHHWGLESVGYNRAVPLGPILASIKESGADKWVGKLVV